MKEKRTNYEYECLGTPPSEALHILTLRYAFPRVSKVLAQQTLGCGTRSILSFHTTPTSQGQPTIIQHGLSNPMDIVSSSVTKKLVGFIKIHLKKPQVDELCILPQTCVFALEFEGGKMVIGKVEERVRACHTT